MDAKTYLETHWIKHGVWNRLLLPTHQKRLRKCAEAVAGGKAFIDIGCACGHSTSIMRGFCPGDWTGVDFGESAIVMARKLFPDIKFLHCLGVDGVPKGGWDGVVCSEVIEHVEDPADFVRGLGDITAPGGTLAVTTPNLRVSDPGHLRVFNRDTLAELFAAFPGKAEIQPEERFFYIIAHKEK